MNIVLYGNESLLIKSKLSKLKKQYAISEENMNLSTYYLNEDSMETMIQDALTPTFLTEYKMIIVRKPLFLTTTKQKNVDEKQVEQFIKFIKQDIPELIFVLVVDEDVFDKRKKVYKVLKEVSQMIECSPLDYYKVLQVTHDNIKKRNASIEEEALNLLVDLCQSNLYRLQSEVEKLTLYTSHITKEDVETLVSRPIEDNVFALTQAIIKHDQAKTMEIYQDLIKNNQEPIALIGLLATTFRNIYEVKLMERKGYQDKEIAKALGLNPRSLYPIRKNGEAFELNEILDHLHALSQLDIKIKSGLFDKYKGLELFLLRV